ERSRFPVELGPLCVDVGRSLVLRSIYTSARCVARTWKRHRAGDVDRSLVFRSIYTSARRVPTEPTVRGQRCRSNDGQAVFLRPRIRAVRAEATGREAGMQIERRTRRLATYLVSRP